MDCKDCQKAIEAFLNNLLNESDTLKFLKHIEKCKECRDELEVQYLVRLAVNTEENGEIPGDPGKSFTDLLKNRKKTVRLNFLVSVLSVILFMLIVPDLFLLIRFLF